ncbi:ATP-binding protein, partial [Pseudoflavonifractor phocaeensis]|uniref:ATP-binding protein n=1 Tax=Pseudoflavonifractor phocaeensis TaxID=1870988 RepID=UPI00195CEDC4
PCAPVLDTLPRWPAGCPFTFEGLTDFYRTHGSGLFARGSAFLWEDGQLFPVEQPDCPAADEMLGYRLQRDQVIANTRAMLEGHHVNNVLLFGESGTGKSATVKSLLALPGFEDLRLIEVQKEGLADLPRLIRTLGGRRLKFILFIDDLAFDQDDTTYSVMKTILEGGLERRPANVAIYATSNRRHLVRQTFSDRAGDEVDASETIQEKTSLAERFGLRIPYLALNKAEFLDLVEQMAVQHGITMDRQALRTGADRWEMRHPGRTPRTAKQYIASLSLA